MKKIKQVAVIMGSKSDMPVMEETLNILEEFGVGFESKVLSAHRTPRKATEFAESASKTGFKVIIAAAGGAAHLAGTLAARTILPVIGVPVETKSLGGIDSLLSTVQMPAGIPVATVAIGKAGAVNAALLAIQILGLEDKGLKVKLALYKRRLASSK